MKTVEEKFSCRICASDKDKYWISDNVFGTLCQQCREKYSSRLLTVASNAATKEIEKIKGEWESDIPS
jgi:hypothetical protein